MLQVVSATFDIFELGNEKLLKIFYIYVYLNTKKLGMVVFCSLFDQTALQCLKIYFNSSLSLLKT